MQITNEKPTIDPVTKAYLRVKRQEIEQKDRSNDIFEMHSCFRELETANFETLNPEMKHLISFNTSTLYGNLCKVVTTGLNYSQSSELNPSNLKPDLTESGLYIVTGWTAEPCFCPFVRENWN